MTDPADVVNHPPHYTAYQIARLTKPGTIQINRPVEHQGVQR